MERDHLEMFTKLDSLVCLDHPYRKFETVVDLDALAKPVSALYCDRGRPGLSVRFGCWFCSFLKIFWIARWSGSCVRTWRPNGFAASV